MNFGTDDQSFRRDRESLKDALGKSKHANFNKDYISKSSGHAIEGSEKTLTDSDRIALRSKVLRQNEKEVRIKTIKWIIIMTAVIIGLLWLIYVNRR